MKEGPRSTRGHSTLENSECGAYDCGRVINPKTAHSQAIGAIISHAGQALFEQTETDRVMGRFLNRNYSGCLVQTRLFKRGPCGPQVVARGSGGASSVPARRLRSRSPGTGPG